MTTGRPTRGEPLNLCRGGQAGIPHQVVVHYGKTCPVCERQARVDSLLEQLAQQRTTFDAKCATCPERRPS